jgi:hypothetical protein
MASMPVPSCRRALSVLLIFTDLMRDDVCNHGGFDGGEGASCLCGFHSA